ncbi:hypothetical protein BH09BAC1_BH09BAC1_22480 [soil metagenome]
MDRFKGYTVCLLLMLLQISCSNYKEQLQGKWHGEIVMGGGQYYFNGNIEILGDSVYFHYLPTENSYSFGIQAQNFDSVFCNLEIDIEDSILRWWSEDCKSFSTDCVIYGDFHKGFLPNFPQHYLQNLMYGPFEVSIIAHKGVSVPLPSYDKTIFDSTPVL